MKKRRLGKSNIEVSLIGLGCWSFGGGEYWGLQDQSDVNNVVGMALDSGINLFDTAEMYNNGASEESLGAAVKGKRSEAVICSKISPSNAHPSTLVRHCEASLGRLGTDYIDIYMLHWPINPVSIKHFTSDEAIMSQPPSVQGTFETLMALKKQGKIREIGISNFGVEQMKEVLTTGADIVVNEITYSVVSRAIEKDIVPFCIENNIGIMSSMTLQQGLLTGKYETPEDVPAYQARSRHFKNDRGRGLSRHFENGAEEEVFETVDHLRKIAAELDIDMAQLSIAWALAKPGISCALAGSRNIGQLSENLKAGNVTLSDEIIARIDEISEPVLKNLGYNPDYYENSKNSRIK